MANMDDRIRAEVIRLADSGMSYADIAKRLQLSYWHVYAHFRRKNRKLFRLKRTNTEQRAAILIELLKMRSYAAIARVHQLHRSSILRIARNDAKAAMENDEKTDPESERIPPEIQIQQLRNARRCPVCHARVKTSPCVACLANRNKQG
jgi:DNA invertase Pin-like site-specific DNA recombinase